MTQEWIDQRILFLILHILGTVLGAGAAFTGDAIFLTSVRNKILTLSEIRILKITGNIVWVGLIIALISGIGLVLQRPEIFLHSEKLWAKITIVVVIVVNGAAFHLIHRPTFERSIGKKFSTSSEIVKKRKGIVISGAISVISWSFVIVLGVLGRTPFTYFQFIGVYVFMLMVACATAIYLGKFILSPSKKLPSK